MKICKLFVCVTSKYRFFTFSYVDLSYARINVYFRKIECVQNVFQFYF